MTIDGIKAMLKELAEKQDSQNAYCKLRFKFPYRQKSLRSGLEGHIAYDVELEGQYRHGVFNFLLNVDYVYSSTCPCSFELAHDARTRRKAAANAHSQRSRMKCKVQFNEEQFVWIEDIIELCRVHIPTEVQVVVKREDEQAFAELNGSNLLFSEDVCRIMYSALDVWHDEKLINDFSIVVSHEESLHPWNAIAVTSKYDDIDPLLL